MRCGLFHDLLNYIELHSGESIILTTTGQHVFGQITRNESRYVWEYDLFLYYLR